MRVELLDIRNNVRGVISLNADGVVVFDQGAAWVRSLFVRGPDGAMTTADGIEYLRALPWSIDGTHTRARLTEEEEI